MHLLGNVRGDGERRGDGGGDEKRVEFECINYRRFLASRSFPKEKKAERRRDREKKRKGDPVEQVDRMQR